MTKEEKYTLAKWAMQYALDNGASEVSVRITENKNSEVEVREKKIDQLSEAIRAAMNLRLFVDNKYSSHSTNRLNKKELERFIKEAVEGTKFLAKDEFRTLPDPDLYYKGDKKELKQLDTGYETIAAKNKIDLTFGIEDEVYKKDERIITATASYYDELSKNLMVTSNGFEGDSANSYFGLYASVSVDGGDARPQGNWSESSLFFDTLKKNGVGKIALDKAI